jgi:hypothetical protein
MHSMWFVSAVTQVPQLLLRRHGNSPALMVAPLNLTCSLHTHDLDAPRRPGLLQAVSLTDEIRVLIGCAPNTKRITALKEVDIGWWVVYEALGVNDIPIP